MRVVGNRHIQLVTAAIAVSGALSTQAGPHGATEHQLSGGETMAKEMSESRLSLEKRLEKLEFLEEIRDLRRRYHYYINEGMFEKVADLYLDDAIVDFGYVGGASGRDDIRALYLSVPETLDFVKQFIHNHIVELGDNHNSATGISYLEARYAREGRSVMVAAKMEEIYTLTPDGWRIKRTDVDVYFSAPLDEGWAGSEKDDLVPFRPDKSKP